MARQIVTIEVQCSNKHCGKTIRFEMFEDTLVYGITNEGLLRNNFPRSQFPEWDLQQDCNLGYKLFCSSKCKGRHIIDNLHLWMGRRSKRTQQTLEGIIERAQEKLKICKKEKE